jgi:hypothetical protein
MTELPRQSDGQQRCPCGLAWIDGCHCGNAEAIAAQLAAAPNSVHVPFVPLDSFPDDALERLASEIGREGRRRGWGDYWLDDLEYRDLTPDG